MDKNIGSLVKGKRKEKGITQKDLAQGICTQATISLLENKNKLPKIKVLEEIGSRLDINLEHGYQKYKHNDFIFNNVKDLCKSFKHEEAYNLLTTKINVDTLETNHEKKVYYYYLGATELVAFKDYKQAMIHFNLTINVGSLESLTIEDLLAKTGIGNIFFMENKNEIAEIYYTEVLNYLDNKKMYNFFDTALVNIYYNISKYYSSIGEYKKSVELCKEGLNISKAKQSLYGIVNIYYELAYNLAKLEKFNESEKYFFISAALATMEDNQLILDTIKKNRNDFNLKNYKY